MFMVFLHEKLLGFHLVSRGKRRWFCVSSLYNDWLFFCILSMSKKCQKCDVQFLTQNVKSKIPKIDLASRFLLRHFNLPRKPENFFDNFCRKIFLAQNLTFAPCRDWMANQFETYFTMEIKTYIKTIKKFLTSLLTERSKQVKKAS